MKYEHYQEYLKRIPALQSKPVPISLDEWAYMGGPQNSYKVVPAYAWAFHEMFRHSDLYQLGGFTFATAMISADRTDAVLSPTGLLFKMYRDHFGKIPVEVSGDSPQPKPLYPVGGDQPRVNPGSDTYPLDVSAALSDDRKTLTFAVLNPSDSEQRLNLSVSGAKFLNQGRLWRMAPPTVDATITVGQKPGVAVEEQGLASVPLEARGANQNSAPLSFGQERLWFMERFEGVRGHIPLSNERKLAVLYLLPNRWVDAAMRENGWTSVPAEAASADPANTHRMGWSGMR